MKSDANKSLLGMIGLCRRAGGVICGSDLVCAELGTRRPPYLVLVSDRASSATVDRITKKCFHYDVKCLLLSIDTVELGHTVGKLSDIATIGIRNEAFAKRIEELINELN